MDWRRQGESDAVWTEGASVKEHKRFAWTQHLDVKAFFMQHNYFVYLRNSRLVHNSINLQNISVVTFNIYFKAKLKISFLPTPVRKHYTWLCAMSSIFWWHISLNFAIHCTRRMRLKLMAYHRSLYNGAKHHQPYHVHSVDAVILVFA